MCLQWVNVHNQLYARFSQTFYKHLHNLSVFLNAKLSERQTPGIGFIKENRYRVTVTVQVPQGGSQKRACRLAQA